MVGPVDWDQLVLAPCQNVFGEEVQWISSLNPDPVLVTGIFDNGYKAMPLEIVDGLSTTHVTTADARLGVQLSQFVSAPQQGDLSSYAENNTVCVKSSLIAMALLTFC